MVSSSIFRLLFVLLTPVVAFVPNNNKLTFSHRVGKCYSTSSDQRSVEEADKQRRMTEFLNLEPLADSEKRRERKERETRNKVRFAKFGDALWDLRASLTELSAELVDAIETGEEAIEEAIRDTLRKVEGRDPEFVYSMELEAMEDAERDGRMEDYEEHKQLAQDARSCLPQFNLNGLWVGKYGNHGYEMINVTYAGDVLVATKVTGDKNVPLGELTFQADLSPKQPRRISSRGNQKQALQPITLTDKAAKKWGTKQLPRYHGLGQVAEEGFTNSQWMDGQLIIIGEEYFSFAWVPIEHQIFFGRPSPELALKMLREGGATPLKDKTWEAPPTLEDDPAVLRDFAAYCLEATSESIAEDLSGDEFSCIWHGIETEECYFE